MTEQNEKQLAAIHAIIDREQRIHRETCQDFNRLALARLRGEIASCFVYSDDQYRDVDETKTTDQLLQLIHRREAERTL